MSDVPGGQVIDLADRRKARASGGGRETALIDINSLRLRFKPDGGLEIVVDRVRGADTRELAWGLDRESAREIAGEVTRLYHRAALDKIHAEHPELAPKSHKPPAYRLCGLTRAGGSGGKRGMKCSRRRGHHGMHKDAGGSWSMPCPCPGSKTKIYEPDKPMRVGYPKCVWCGALRDHAGNVVGGQVRAVEAPR